MQRPAANVTLGRAKSKFNRGGPTQAPLRPMTENPQQSKLVGQSKEEHEKSFFAKLARSCTCAFCCTDNCLVGAIDKETKEVKKVQDWREKVTICIIFACVMAFVAFFTVGMSDLLCPKDATNIEGRDDKDDFRTVFGYGFRFKDNLNTFTPALEAKANGGIFRSQFFSRDSLVQALAPGSCTGSSQAVSLSLPCDGDCIDFSVLKPVGEAKKSNLPESFVTYKDVLGTSNKFILNGNVVDFTEYLNQVKQPIANDPVDAAIRKYTSDPRKGRDATLEFDADPNLQPVLQCLSIRYRSIGIKKDGPGCFISQLINILALVAILGIILSRFFLAIYFSCVMEPRLIAKKDTTTPPIVILVTCYNEDSVGLKGTFESLANTTYASDSKLLFVVCDGINIKGSGAPKPTSELCKDLIQLDNTLPVLPMDYFSIESGSKQHNKAQIYIGHYHSDIGSVMPVVVCVKAGTPKDTGARAGNRGKRDSQIILMKFWSSCFYDDRMSPLEIDMYNKIYYLTKIVPEEFEYNLMVDADTVVESNSLDLLIGAMKNDHAIMGMCGETRIVNKSASWVTKIQVFEYYISHHMAKSFESAFGGVTCLPGCFCLYRIKAPKMVGNKKSWVPILAHRDISDQYSKTDVHTLHERNLLLLGEDRFLTTLMLRNFPKRKQIFVPSARCYTEAPDTFAVLIDQRRRWINSTLHNLFELIFVNQLCGIMCCSMQFVVALEVFGTISLPMAIVLTYVLIIKYIVDAFNGIPQTFTHFIPLILFLVVLLLPGVLVLITRREMEYIGWMFYYIGVGLPVWNFVLPLYAYWKMDEFSWGKTRVVEGEQGDHGGGSGAFDPRSIVLKRQREWNQPREKGQTLYEEFVTKQGKGVKDMQSGSNLGSSSNVGSNASTPVPIQGQLQYQDQQYSEQPYVQPGQYGYPADQQYGQYPPEQQYADPYGQPQYPPQQQYGQQQQQNYMMPMEDGISQLSSVQQPTQEFYQTSPTHQGQPQYYDLGGQQGQQRGGGRGRGGRGRGN